MIYKIPGTGLTISQACREYDLDESTIRGRLRRGEKPPRLFMSLDFGSVDARRIAKENGEKFYIGRPCKQCGARERYTNSCNCMIDHYRKPGYIPPNHRN